MPQSSAAAKNPAAAGFFVEIELILVDQAGRPTGTSTVVADGFDRAAFHGLLTGGFFFGSSRLLHHVRISAIIPSGVILGGGFAAQVAVDALVVDEVLASDVFGIPICNVSHKSKSDPIYRPRKAWVQAAFS
jgi:hypothetical protein